MPNKQIVDAVVFYVPLMKVKPRRVSLSDFPNTELELTEEDEAVVPNDDDARLVHRVGCEHVKGFSLAMSRSLGDFMLKLRADLPPEEQLVSFQDEWSAWVS
jgi:hypothetical protein